METLQQFSERIASQAKRPALVDLTGEERAEWDFEALAADIDKFANGLVADGLGPGDRVALVAENGAGWIIAALGVIRAGGVAVPVDTQFSAEQLGHVLALARPAWAFTSRRMAEQVAGLDLEAPPRIIRLDDGERGDGEAHWTDFLHDGTGSRAPAGGADDTAVIFFTSGTTGPPKGVPLSHRNLTHQLDVLAGLDLVGEGDRVLLPLPLHHVYPFTIGLLAPLHLGLPVILPAGLTGSQLAAALDAEDVTFIIGLPRLYRALHEGIENRISNTTWPVRPILRGLVAASTWVRARLGLRVGRVLLRPLHRRFAPKLTTLVSGGAALPGELALKLEGLGWRVGSGYGLTETSPLLTIVVPKSLDVHGAGRVVDGVDLRISAPRDEAGRGEVQVRGPNVFAGYLDQPEKTREAFTEDGWFRTGDRGRLRDDGMLELSGRLSTLIVTEAGENIQPDQVEEAYEKHPAIAEMGVLERNNRLVAVVVPDVQALQDTDARDVLSAAIKERAGDLPSYHRLAGFEISREKLPRTRLGKIRRGKLDELYGRLESGELEQEKGALAIEDMDPGDRQLLEDEGVRGVWFMLAERYPQVRLTPDSSLSMDVGVDSLAWVELTFAINERSGVDLDEEDVAEIDTVRELLETVAHKTPEAGSTARADPIEQPNAVLSDADRRWTEPRSRAMRWLGSFGYRVNRLIFRTLFRLETDGLENVPRTGAVIIAPNHMSYLDAPAVAAALDNARLDRLRWAGYRQIMMGNALMRAVSRAARVVPIDPSGGAGKSLAYGAETLKAGEALVWFPEGALSRTGKLQRFQPGAAILASRLDVPLLPVIITGSGEALPPDTHWPRRSQIRVVFGKPLTPGEARTGQAEEADWRALNDALRQRMTAIARRLDVYPDEPT